jgi:hypothetical protein
MVQRKKIAPRIANDAEDQLLAYTDERESAYAP